MVVRSKTVSKREGDNIINSRLITTGSVCFEGSLFKDWANSTVNSSACR